MEDLFAAMPPFELVKALLVKAAQRRDRTKTVRKVMFVDVSKAPLYAPVGPEDKPYVAARLSAGSREFAGSLVSGYMVCTPHPMDGRRSICGSWGR